MAEPLNIIEEIELRANVLTLGAMVAFSELAIAEYLLAQRFDESEIKYPLNMIYDIATPVKELSEVIGKFLRKGEAGKETLITLIKQYREANRDFWALGGWETVRKYNWPGY